MECLESITKLYNDIIVDYSAALFVGSISAKFPPKWNTLKHTTFHLFKLLN